MRTDRQPHRCRWRIGTFSIAETELHLDRIESSKYGVLGFIIADRICESEPESDCDIGVAGAHSLAEALTENQTLTALGLFCMISGLFSLAQFEPDESLGNQIGDSGAQALSVSLKQNSALRTLSLGCMRSQLREPNLT
jgi:hypothetical protein